MGQFWSWLLSQLSFDVLKQYWLSFTIVLILGCLCGSFLYSKWHSKKIEDFNVEKKRINQEKDNALAELEKVKNQNVQLEEEINRIKIEKVKDVNYWLKRRNNSD